MHTEFMHACMDAISAARRINQSALFNTDVAGGDTYQMNQCQSAGRVQERRREFSPVAAEPGWSVRHIPWIPGEPAEGV